MSKELTTSQKRSLAAFNGACTRWFNRWMDKHDAPLQRSDAPLQWSDVQIAWDKGREQGRKMERKGI